VSGIAAALSRPSPIATPISPSIADLLASYKPLPSLPTLPLFFTPTHVAPIETVWAQPPVETHEKTGSWWYLPNAANCAPASQGVYIIWRGGDRRVVRVGQGNIASRLSDHNRDSSILMHGQSELLFATWSPLQSWLCDGAERYLADHYQPLVGDRFPDCSPIMIRLPA
jgi:hypothetical protein